jgi:hypothetical protein
MTYDCWVQIHYIYLMLHLGINGIWKEYLNNFSNITIIFFSLFFTRLGQFPIQHCILVISIRRTQIFHKAVSTDHIPQWLSDMCCRRRKNLLSRSVSQAHWSFLKKRCRLISSTPFLPNLTSLNREGGEK